MDKKLVIKIIVALFAIIILGLLLSQVTISDLVGAFTSISIEYLALCFVLYTGSNLARAARFSVMLKKPSNFLNVFNITCIHNMANNILPFKTGELAFVYLTRSRLNLPVSIGAATVAIVRIFDALSVCVLFTVAIAAAGDTSGILSSFTPIMLFLAAMMTLLIVLILYFGPMVERLLEKVPRVMIMGRDPVKFIRAKVGEISGYYSTPESRRNVPSILALSLIVWIFNTTAMFVLITNLGVYMGYWVILIGTLISAAFSALPIHGVGRFGTNELYWTSIFIAFGSTKELAITTGLVTHVVLLAFTIVLGLIALGLDRFAIAGEKSTARSG